MNIFDLLVKATTARFIDWKPTGEEARIEGYSVIWKGYEATIDGFKVRIIARSHKSCIAYGIVIEKDGQTQAFTSAPKIIPGEKRDGVSTCVILIQSEMNSRDIMSSLRQSLARMLFS